MLERHVQTRLLSLITGLLGWILLSTEQHGRDIVRIDTRTAALEEKIDRNMDDRYRKQDAKADLALRDKRLDDIEARVRNLERR